MSDFTEDLRRLMTHLADRDQREQALVQLILWTLCIVTLTWTLFSK